MKPNDATKKKMLKLRKYASRINILTRSASVKKFFRGEEVWVDCNIYHIFVQNKGAMGDGGGGGGETDISSNLFTPIRHYL